MFVCSTRVHVACVGCMKVWEFGGSWKQNERGSYVIVVGARKHTKMTLCRRYKDYALEDETCRTDMEH